VPGIIFSAPIVRRLYCCYFYAQNTLMNVPKLSGLLFLLLLCGIHVPAQDTAQVVVPGRSNAPAQQKKPYVILISADGFRYDLAERYHANTLLQLGKEGVRAAYLQPSFPSLTFPNHYTIVTGLYPAHHGLLDNSMYDKKKKQYYSIGNHNAVTDSSWYGGVPLWVLAEQQKMLSASFYWVGSEAAIDGVRPTYYYNYNEKIGIDERIAAVKKWLEMPEDKRPHFIAFYLPEVDHAEHKYGPDAKETADAVAFVDEAIKKMTETLATLHLDIDYVFVADHGMTTVDNKNPLPLPAAVDTAKFIVTGGGSILHLYAKDPADIDAAFDALKMQAKEYDVYLNTQTPEHWHYRKNDDYYNRIGDIVLIPHLPKVFNLGSRTPPIGQHGFDPEFKDMRATFYAWGPAFKKHQEIPGFENVHIYPLITQILGLQYDQPIDGKLSVLQGILE
jgi:predicted AlkP superfamily pyrophosphatase or phosphodiesterase